MSTILNTRLSEQEVRSRLAVYTDPEVTDELYKFGSVMVDKALDRFKSLDTKATAIAAYSIGVITLLASTQAIWFETLKGMAVLPVLSGAAAFISASCAISALWLRRSEWFSQDEWLQTDCLSDAEALRRYHLLNMWGVLTSHQTACDGKAARIALAEGSLFVSAVILLISLVLTWVLRLPLGFGIALW